MKQFSKLFGILVLGVLGIVGCGASNTVKGSVSVQVQERL